MDMAKKKEDYRAAGLKKTTQREAILQIFLTEDRYLTPEEVWQRLKGCRAGAGLPTVYRNLEIFGQMGLLAKVAGADNRYYYGRCRAKSPKAHHHHIVCTGCRRISEVEICNFAEMRKEVEKETGYKVTGHTLQWEGLCLKCQH